MAQSPKNIMIRLGSALEGRTCTMKELRRAFFNAGYGPTKTAKWINLYLQEGIITEAGQDENGIALFDSEWWYKPEWVRA